jgi:hypothetical protein
MRWLLIALLLGLPAEVRAASPEYCAPYADALKVIVVPLTGGIVVSAGGKDRDLADFLRDRAYSTCLNADEPPVIKFITGITDEPPGTAPATGPVTPEVTSDHDVWCRKHFPKSFDPDTGMVKTRSHGKWKVIPCPK